MLLARKLCLAIAIVLGLLIAARMLLGSFQLAGIAVNVPLNPEGLFGLAMLCAVALSSRPGGSAIDALSTATSTKKIIYAMAGAALVSVLACIPALRVPFVSDDFILIKMARDSSLATLSRAFTSAGGDGFYRPLGYVSLAINHWLAGTNSELWHASALAIQTMNAVLVVLLSRRLGMSLFGATLAGMLFALHGTHPEATVWIAGRFDLLATLFTLLGLTLFIAYLKRPAILTLLASLLAMTLALLSKEAAYVFPFVLVPIVWLLQPGGRKPDAIWRVTRPYFALTAVVFLIRAALLGGIGGYRIAGTGESSFFSLKLGTTLKVLFVRLWTSLFFPVNWSTEASIWLALSGAMAIMAMLWIAFRSRANSVFGPALVCLAISILPPLHLLGGAADLSGGRLLYLPSVFFCIVLAASAEALDETRARYAVGAALLLFHFLALRHTLAEWNRTGRLVQAACEVASAMPGPVAVKGLPLSIHGVPAFANGFPECVELSSGRRNSVNFVESDRGTAELPMLVWDNDAQSLRSRSGSSPGDTR